MVGHWINTLSQSHIHTVLGKYGLKEILMLCYQAHPKDLLENYMVVPTTSHTQCKLICSVRWEAWLWTVMMRSVIPLP